MHGIGKNKARKMENTFIIGHAEHLTSGAFAFGRQQGNWSVCLWVCQTRLVTRAANFQPFFGLVG